MTSHAHYGLDVYSFALTPREPKHFDMWNIGVAIALGAMNFQATHTIRVANTQ